MSEQGSFQRLTLALYRDRGDDEQEAVLDWLATLPRRSDGSFQREVLRRHMLRAMYQYVMHGAPKYPLTVENGQQKAIQTTVQAQPVVSQPVAQTVEKQVVEQVVQQSVMPVPMIEPALPVEKQPSDGKIRLGSSLRNRFAKSMSNGDSQ